MNGAFDSVFDTTRWEHWLLVASFLGLAAYGLWLSWQWRCAARKRRRTALSRYLAMEMYARQPDGWSTQAASDTASLDTSKRSQAARAQAACPSSAWKLTQTSKRRNLN